MRSSQSGLSRRFAELQTTAKFIAILSIALAPLGAIALLASLQTNRSADEQRRAELRIATTESARKLATELASDGATLRQALQMLDATPDDPAICPRATAVLSTEQQRGVSFAFFGASTLPLCAAGERIARPSIPLVSSAIEYRRADEALDVVVPSQGGTSVAVARFRTETLAGFARPGAFGRDYRLNLEIDGAPVNLPTESPELGRRTETETVPVGLGGLALTMTANSAPFGAAEALLTFLPLLMWAAAALIGYYVVDRLLIEPLKVLRAAVVSYQPGSSRRILADTPAVEIRELEASFTAYADRLAEREVEVEAALANQVKLTREVHHRVKNNLQVIASLISLHARDTQSEDAARAHAKIQRRVDALAIVHRNHFAEFEANHGIDARALLSELVGNFRSSFGAGHDPAQIQLVASPLSISQDVATPLAFLFTELVEAALTVDAETPIRVSLTPTGPDTARFEIATAELARVEESLGNPTMRIVEGLARQLRAKLERDTVRSTIAVTIPTILPSFSDS